MRRTMITRSLVAVAVAVAVAAGCGNGRSSETHATPATYPTISAYVQSKQTYSPEQCHPINITNKLYSEMDGYQCVSTGPASRPVAHLKGVPGPVPTVTYWLHIRDTPIIAQTVLNATWLAGY